MEINEDLPEKLKEQVKEQVVEENSITKEQEEIIAKAFEEAKMPVEYLDKDFKLGDNELDIRKLNKANREQMTFRMAVLNIVYQRQITQSLVDIERLLMLVLKQQGVTDVIKATDDLLTELKSKIN